MVTVSKTVYTVEFIFMIIASFGISVTQIIKIKRVVEVFVDDVVELLLKKLLIIKCSIKNLHQDSSSRGISYNFIRDSTGPIGGVNIITLIFFGT